MVIKSQDAEFKLGKTVLLLLLFQLLVNKIVSFIIYVLTSIVMIFPSSMSHNTLIGFAALALSSFLYGKWMAKKYPAMLDTLNVNKIALWVGIIQLTVGVMILTPTLYHLYVRGTPMFEPVILSIMFTLINSSVIYIITKIFLTRGGAVHANSHLKQS